MRVFGSKGLMHYEIDFGTWDTPEKLHKTSTLYIQRGKDGYGKREELKVPESDMFRAELELFAAELPHAARANELSADNGNVARRDRLRGAALDRGERPRRAHRRRHRGGAGPRRRKEPQCCLAAISSN